MVEKREFKAERADGETRLDRFLAACVPDLTRSHLQKLIAAEHVRVDGRVRTKAGFTLVGGESVELNLPEPVAPQIVAEAIPLDILYEDDQLVVINKARGMVVHPAAGNRQGTLVNALLSHCRDLSGINGVTRPGIVHRLDKDTSGVMLAAKTDSAHVSLAEQIRRHTAGREYLAVVHGHFAQSEGHIEGAIGRDPRDRKKMSVLRQGGKPAVTHFRVLETLGPYSLVCCRLETGRTHQIRVHMAAIGHPLAGDPKYGPSRSGVAIRGQALHSFRIHFRHPMTGEEMSFTAPMPSDMQELVDKLRHFR